MFRDEECRVRTDNAPANFTTIKHMALNLIRRKSSGKKDSLRVRRKVASWDDDYLASLVGGRFFHPIPLLWADAAYSVCIRRASRIAAHIRSGVAGISTWRIRWAR
jgi:predicted transposase YbfD/YdcC